MTPSTTEAARVARLRRRARRDGLALSRDRQSGCWYVIDANRNAIVAGDRDELPDLDALEVRLTG